MTDSFAPAQALTTTEPYRFDPNTLLRKAAEGDMHAFDAVIMNQAENRKFKAYCLTHFTTIVPEDAPLKHLLLAYLSQTPNHTDVSTHLSNYLASTPAPTGIFKWEAIKMLAQVTSNEELKVELREQLNKAAADSIEAQYFKGLFDLQETRSQFQLMIKNKLEETLQQRNPEETGEIIIIPEKLLNLIDEIKISLKNELMQELGLANTLRSLFNVCLDLLQEGFFRAAATICTLMLKLDAPLNIIKPDAHFFGLTDSSDEEATIAAARRINQPAIDAGHPVAAYNHLRLINRNDPEYSRCIETAAKGGLLQAQPLNIDLLHKELFGAPLPSTEIENPTAFYPEDRSSDIINIRDTLAAIQDFAPPHILFKCGLFIINTRHLDAGTSKDQLIQGYTILTKAINSTEDPLLTYQYITFNRNNGIELLNHTRPHLTEDACLELYRRTLLDLYISILNDNLQAIYLLHHLSEKAQSEDKNLAFKLPNLGNKILHIYKEEGSFEFIDEPDNENINEDDFCAFTDDSPLSTTALKILTDLFELAEEFGGEIPIKFLVQQPTSDEESIIQLTFNSSGTGRIQKRAALPTDFEEGSEDPL